MLVFMCACYTCLWFFFLVRALPAVSLANSEIMLVGFGCSVLHELPLGNRTSSLGFGLSCGSSKEFGDQEWPRGM